MTVVSTHVTAKPNLSGTSNTSPPAPEATIRRGLYTADERRRRDASRWTFVQGVLAPLQFLVMAVSVTLVLRYLYTGQGLAAANLSVVVKTIVLYTIMVTGVIFALERGAATRTVGLVLASVLALWGAWLLYAEREVETPSGVRRGFLGAAFLWTWVQVLFYGGWLVGPSALAVPVPAEAPSLSLAVRAVTAMLWYQLAMLLVLGVSAGLVASRPNRIGWWALLTFWISHQAASINIFLGVENPGRGFFPDGVTFLESYFGPSRNSWLLPISVAMLLVFTLRVALHAVRDATPMRRQAMMLLTVLGALSVLELAVLGTPVNLALWDWFLALRGY